MTDSNPTHDNDDDHDHGGHGDHGDGGGQSATTDTNTDTTGDTSTGDVAAHLKGGLQSLTDVVQAGGVAAASTIIGTRLFPKSEKLWLGITKLGLKKVKKTTGADIIGFLSSEGGQLEPAPMKLKQRDEDDSKYWATVENDVEYDIGPQGVSRDFIGNVPVGFFVEDPPREVSLLEARARDAVDLGQHQPLVDGSVTLHEHGWMPANAIEGGSGDRGGAAMADGGNAQAQGGKIELFDREIEIDADDVPKDGIVDLSTESGNGARVSWTRVNDILHETPPTEQMVMQEQRGELAGAAGNEEKIQRIALYAILGIVAVVFIFFLGPSIVNAVFGSGTFSGVGGAVPSIGGG